MEIAFYCRMDGQGFGFVLPDEADKLREFFAEHQDKPALKIHQAQAKNFCRVLDIRVSKAVKSQSISTTPPAVGRAGILPYIF